MITILQTTRSLFERRSRHAAALTLIGLFLLLATAYANAEDPWNSTSLGWSSSAVPSHGWSSWETTRGGTFGGSSASLEPSAGPSHASRRKAHYAPLAAIHDSAIDPVMIKAGSIAEQRALSHSTLKCWRFVKEALVAAGGVSSYPQTAYARDAGAELMRNYGFVRLAVNCAERAPVGSVCVYGGSGAGHVELRSPRGFVSDYYCPRPSGLPFIGAYTRLDKHHKQIDTAQVTSSGISGS